MKAFRANMLIFFFFFFLFPWGSRKAWQCHRGSGQQNWWKTLPAFFFFFLPSSFIHIVFPPFSPQLSVSIASLYGSSVFFFSSRVFKQPFSSVSLFLSATFLASLIPTLSILPAAFLPLLSSTCEELLINKDKRGRTCLCVCVCLRDGRQLSDSIVSLSTSPHSTAHPATGFLPPLPPTPASIQAPSQEGGFGGQVGGQDGGFIVVGAIGWGPGIQAKPQTQDPDLACQPAH